jgi:formylmethanofuran dehydrogenase subunit E
LTENIDFQLESLLVESEKFHGHLGPFLVIGLKAGLVGLKELNAQRGNRDLFVRVLCEDEIPFTCAIDGLQFSTGCTTGNKRLSFEKSLGMVIEVKNNERTIKMILNHKFFETLRAKLLGKKFQNEKLRELAYEIAKIEENRLFSIEYY